MKLKSIVLNNILAMSFACFCLTSCATVDYHNNLTMPLATLDLGALPRDNYVILGKVSGDSELVVSKKDMKKEAEDRLLPKVNKKGEARPSLKIKAIGDAKKYGFVGQADISDMTIEERAIASATYNMMELARYNRADAILYMQTTCNVIDGKDYENPDFIIVKANVSGIAIKLKSDDGAFIKTIPKISLTDKEDELIMVSDVIAMKERKTE